MVSGTVYFAEIVRRKAKRREYVYYFESDDSIDQAWGRDFGLEFIIGYVEGLTDGSRGTVTPVNGIPDTLKRYFKRLKLKPLDRPTLEYAFSGRGNEILLQYPSLLDPCKR